MCRNRIHGIFRDNISKRVALDFKSLVADKYVACKWRATVFESLSEEGIKKIFSYINRLHENMYLGIKYI